MNSSEININTEARKKMKRKSQFRNDLDAWILFLPSLVVLYLLIWRPTVLGAVWSFFKMNAYTPAGFCGLDNFRKVITHTVPSDALEHGSIRIMVAYPGLSSPGTYCGSGKRNGSL